MGTELTESFIVITDKKPKLPRVFIQHDITSKFTIAALKYSDYNIMATLQPLRVWMNFKKFSTHRQGSTGF